LGLSSITKLSSPGSPTLNSAPAAFWPAEAPCSRLLHLRHRRNRPAVVEDRRVLFLRPIKPQHQDEPAGGRRQPVRFPLAAWRFVLDIEIDRAVLVARQGVAGAERVAVQPVR